MQVTFALILVVTDRCFGVRRLHVTDCLNQPLIEVFR